MRRSATVRRYPRPSAASVLRPQPRIAAFIGSALVPPRAAMTDAEAIRQMAEDMRNASQREGGITEDDLEVLGFTRTQIKLLGRDAARRAQALSGLS